MIRLEDVFVVFQANTPLERIALRGINLEIKKGEIVSIVGNSGSGRTSLLRFLAGHIMPSFGKLWLNNIDITRQTLSERSEIFSSVFYDHSIGTAGNLTVAENLAVAAMHHQPKSLLQPAMTDDVKEMIFQQLKDINFMNMENMIDKKVNELSKVYRQVLALLIAVTKGAEVILIDEHSTGLDRAASVALLDATEKIIRGRQITTIMAVCDPKYAMEVADRTVVLSHGQVVSDLSGEKKKNTTVESLFASFNIVPQIKDVKNFERKE